jgi:hypothetical protein
MIITDSEIIGSLNKTSVNDHRKLYVGHLFSKETKQSKIVNFYAYDKKDAVALAREYGIRFLNMRLIDLKMERGK